MPGMLFAPDRGTFRRGEFAQPNQPAFLTFIALETIVDDYSPISMVTVPSKIRIIPGVREVWEQHRAFGQYLVAMANIPAIGKSEVKAEFVTEYANNLNRRMNGTLDAFMWCPHDTENQNPMVSVCNCNLPKHYGLTIQAHILLESFYKIPMLVCYQTIVGGEGYKELAEAGNFNYVSQDEIRKDSISLVSKSLSALGSTRLLHMQPKHE